MRKSLLGLLKRERSRSRPSAMSRESSSPAGNEDQRSSQPPATAPESQQGPAATPPAIEAISHSVSEDLWSRAFEALSKREPELVQDYELHMAARQDQNQAPTEAARQLLLSNPESVTRTVKALQDERESKQWSFTIRGKSHKTKTQVENLVELLSFADGIVKQAVSGQPYAALAWSSLSLFLPVRIVVFFAPSDQTSNMLQLVSASFSKETTMVQGFATIADLQLYWRNCEDVFLNSAHSQHYQSLTEPLCNLYSYMLEYQVRAICHLSRKQLSRGWDKLSAQDNWASKESEIVKLSEKCNNHIGPLEKEEIRQISEEKLHQIQDFICQAGADVVGAIEDKYQKKRERQFMQDLKERAGNYSGGMEFNKDPVKGTCEWFYQDENFSRWLTSEAAGVFWVTAGPGCGKSVLARSLVKNGHLHSTATAVNIGLDTRVERREETICYFFFNDEAAQRRSVATAICALLHQLFAQDPTSILIRQALDGSQGSSKPSGLDFNELWEMLVLASESSTQGQVICVLDALDECTAHDREKLITQLDRLYQDERSSSINLKFLVTSRPYDDIELSFKPLLRRTEYFRFDADERYKEISHDIGLVIEARIDTFASDLVEADRQKIVEALKSRGTNTYLWLYLTLELMQKHPSHYSRQRDVERLIAGIPPKVSDAYEKTLNRSENEQMTSALLQILLAAKRPLTVDEANYALTLATADIKIETHAELDEERWKGDFKSVVKNLCGLLVSIYDGKLSFIHLTAREFLLEKLDPGSGAAATDRWRGHFEDSAALHKVLTRICMHYLLLSDFASRKLPTVDGEQSEYGLLYYAALSWAEHFQELDKVSQLTYLPKARQLCNTSLPPLRTWGGLYMNAVRGGGFPYQNFHGWSDLAVVSFVGLQPLVEDLVESVGVDVNELSKGHGTALHAAVARDQESVVAYLISKGAEVNMYVREKTPLDIAVSLRQHHGTIELLLANGASPLAASTYGEFLSRDFKDRSTGSRRYDSYTILSCAAILPDKTIFYMMLASLVRIDSPEAILVAAADQRLIDSGDACRALLLSRLDDKSLGDEKVLTESLLPILFSVPDVGCRILRLLKQQNRQELLISKAILQVAIHVPNVNELLVKFLAKTKGPCSSITQAVLEIVAEYYEPDTLRAFIQSSPKDSCTIKNLILSAVVNVNHRYSAPLVVLEFAKTDIAVDEELQRKLLGTRSGIMGLEIAIVFVFLEMPRLMAPVKKMLALIVLENYRRGPSGNHETLLLRVLEHSGDQEVVDDELLYQAARTADATAVKMLLDRSSGISMAGERYLEAAAGSFFGKGKEVMEFLLDKYGAAAPITPAVVQSAAGCLNGIFEFLLETRPEQVPITTDVVCEIGSKEVLELVIRHKRDDLARIAPRVLRGVVKLREYCKGSIQLLLECCPLSWFEPSEALILDVLERGDWWTVPRISLLINKFGDKVVITESILAAAAACDVEVLEIFKNWKPEHFKVTRWILEKTAACGSPKGLKYLVHASGDALTIEDKWYKLASFRGAVARLEYKSFREEWDEDTLDLNMADVYGKTALHVAATSGRKLPLVRFLLEEARADINATDRRGWTALHFAVYNGNVELVQTLLEAGADPYQAGLEGETPVSIATKMSVKCGRKQPDNFVWILKDEWYSRFMASTFGMDYDKDEEERG